MVLFLTVCGVQLLLDVSVRLTVLLQLILLMSVRCCRITRGNLLLTVTAKSEADSKVLAQWQLAPVRHRDLYKLYYRSNTAFLQISHLLAIVLQDSTMGRRRSDRATPRPLRTFPQEIPFRDPLCLFSR